MRALWGRFSLHKCVIKSHSGMIGLLRCGIFGPQRNDDFTAECFHISLWISL